MDTTQSFTVFLAQIKHYILYFLMSISNTSDQYLKLQLIVSQCWCTPSGIALSLRQNIVDSIIFYLFSSILFESPLLRNLWFFSNKLLE